MCFAEVTTLFHCPSFWLASPYPLVYRSWSFLQPFKARIGFWPLRSDIFSGRSVCFFCIILARRTPCFVLVNSLPGYLASCGNIHDWQPLVEQQIIHVHSFSALKHPLNTMLNLHIKQHTSLRHFKTVRRRLKKELSRTPAKRYFTTLWLSTTGSASENNMFHIDTAATCNTMSLSTLQSLLLDADARRSP